MKGHSASNMVKEHHAAKVTLTLQCPTFMAILKLLQPFNTWGLLSFEDLGRIPPLLGSHEIGVYVYDDVVCGTLLYIVALSKMRSISVYPSQCRRSHSALLLRMLLGWGCCYRKRTELRRDFRHITPASAYIVTQPVCDGRV